jgi:trehalose-6-phosphate synthase
VAGQAEALYQAFTMQVEERRRRLDEIVGYVREHDIAGWIAGQLADLDEARDRLGSALSA